MTRGVAPLLLATLGACDSGALMESHGPHDAGVVPVVDMAAPGDLAEGPDFAIETALDKRRRAIREACVKSAACSPLDAGQAASAEWCLNLFEILNMPPYALAPDSPDGIVFERLVTCGPSVGCPAFLACAGPEATLGTSCGDEDATCDGQVRVGIGGDRFDCASFGLVCGPGDRGACCMASCPMEQPATCQGTRYAGCQGGFAISQECAPAGVCQPDRGQPCVGPGAACDPGGAVSCDGATASFCFGGHDATFDCATGLFDSACAAGGDPLYPCQPAGSECVPRTFVDRCDGDAVVVCADGYLQRVDCVALGFAGCGQAQDAAFARCLP